MHHLVDLLAGLLQAMGSSPGRPRDEAGRRASRHATIMLVVVVVAVGVAVLVLLGIQGALEQ